MTRKEQQLLEEAYDEVNMNINPALRYVSPGAKELLNKHYKQVQQTAMDLAATSRQPLEDLKQFVQNMATRESLTLDDKDINSISEFYFNLARQRMGQRMR